HNVMEIILKPYKGLAEFTSTQILRDKINEVDSLIILEIGKQYGVEFTEINQLNSLQLIMHKIACEYVKMYLEYDAENYQSFRIIELENDEDYVLDFPIHVNRSEERRVGQECRGRSWRAR